MPGCNAIGEYLQARRGRLSPEDVGLPDWGRRRVPGLRREELASLAGISSDYLVRLEQGRDRNPSPDVLDALARALRLDDEAREHLHALARGPATAPPADTGAEVASASVQQLLRSWSATPAYVHGRHLDVVAANPLAHALMPSYSPGVNLLRAGFLDRDVHARLLNWSGVAESGVAALRALTGPDLGDRRLNALVAELSERSDRFGELWSRHDAQLRTSGVHRFHHPAVGEFALGFQRLAVPGSPGQVLVAFSARPGSGSERALATLASTPR